MSEQKKQKEKTFLQFLKENKTVAAMLGVVAVVVIAAAVMIGLFLGKNTEQASLDVPEAETIRTQEGTETAAVVPLEEDANPKVCELINEYYQAAALGDTAKIQELVHTYSQETLIYLEKISNYIEEYRDVKCFTKAGPIENSYVVYASYETKFKDMETLVPGVSPYLVYADEGGSYYIYEGDVDEEVNLYLEEISAQDDVVDLMNRVQVSFNEAVVEDETLNNFLANMKEDLKVEVGEALAEAEAQESKESEGQQPSDIITAEEVRARDVVNVRASDSEKAEKIGKVQTGDILKLLESKPNGWSKVEYDGKEAFIKSEFLEAVASESGNGKEGQQAEKPADNGDGQKQEASSNAGVSTEIPTSGTVMVAETVNVRKSASETADKLGVCYQGDKLEILMQQADGWTKVKYNGKTGYVKTDVLKIMK